MSWPLGNHGCKRSCCDTLSTSCCVHIREQPPNIFNTIIIDDAGNSTARTSTARKQAVANYQYKLRTATLPPKHAEKPPKEKRSRGTKDVGSSRNPPWPRLLRDHFTLKTVCEVLQLPLDLSALDVPNKCKTGLSRLPSSFMWYIDNNYSNDEIDEFVLPFFAGRVGFPSKLFPFDDAVRKLSEGKTNREMRDYDGCIEAREIIAVI
ncbi:hypothetical protein M5K25_002799 [Dendrobium thyrsiflorum]|uniref:Uncharacterized protein n=1 Tax=Dendrobium thyrsiflorum TaxID=117978 RepID=A0ABD0VNC6_DENTH